MEGCPHMRLGNFDTLPHAGTRELTYSCWHGDNSFLQLRLDREAFASIKLSSILWPRGIQERPLKVDLDVWAACRRRPILMHSKLSFWRGWQHLKADPAYLRCPEEGWMGERDRAHPCYLFVQTHVRCLLCCAIFVNICVFVLECILISISWVFAAKGGPLGEEREKRLALPAFASFPCAALCSS